MTWDAQEPGVLALPSGRTVRGRARRRPPPSAPEWALVLAAGAPASAPWPQRHVRWPDLWVPTDPDDAADALREAWRRAASERVEVSCRGGVGRTGTALACLAVLDGLPAPDAVRLVRTRYARRAVETPWQLRLVHRAETW